MKNANVISNKNQRNAPKLNQTMDNPYGDKLNSSKLFALPDAVVFRNVESMSALNSRGVGKSLEA